MVYSTILIILASFSVINLFINFKLYSVFLFFCLSFCAVFSLFLVLNSRAEYLNYMQQRKNIIELKNVTDDCNLITTKEIYYYNNSLYKSKNFYSNPLIKLFSYKDFYKIKPIEY